jgi:hypothetical protein
MSRNPKAVIDWKKVVMIENETIKNGLFSDGEKGARLYFEGGHVIFLVGDWDEICRMFHGARS